MPNNKMLDGIKKLSGQDLKKARDVVLQSIGEKSKHVKPVDSISKEEADKIEAATAKFRPKQVDGLSVKQKTPAKGWSALGGENRPADAKAMAGKQTTDKEKEGDLIIQRDLGQANSPQKVLQKTEQAISDKKELKQFQDEGKLKKEQIGQERLNQEKIKEKQRIERIKQKKEKEKIKQQKKRGHIKTQRHKDTKTQRHKDTKTRKQTRFWLGERRADAQPRLLVTSYLLLILTIIIIVGCVGFFTILYNLNNYAVLAKVSKIKQMMESGANFYQIAKSQGDEFGVGKYYTYNEAAVKFGQNIVNLKAGQISIISAKGGLAFGQEHASSGYYLVQRYGRSENLIGLKFIFIKSRSLDDYVSEVMSGFRLYR
ncbi:hypothetical protein KAU19_00100 [Candidatus Parcubacteria bacterium]|nr:hypothetical protein [Candidatus Parcubacteria bacterium]